MKWEHIVLALAVLALVLLLIRPVDHSHPLPKMPPDLTDRMTTNETHLNQVTRELHSLAVEFTRHDHPHEHESDPELLTCFASGPNLRCLKENGDVMQWP